MKAGWARSLLTTALDVASVAIPNSTRARTGVHPPQTEHDAAPTPPALLTMPSYYGTLAAVRSLGRLQIPVTTASPRRFTIASTSKYTGAHLSCPATTDSKQFLRWLDAFGNANVKHVLLPTCDDTAWLYARHREHLAANFHVGPLDIEAIHQLLHKRHLAEHARAAGLETPTTWFPETEQDLQRVLDEATFPVLVKPVTQVLFESRSKGLVVHRPADLCAAYRNFLKLRHGREIVAYDSSVEKPMVQEYYAEAHTGIYNIAGYARAGKLHDVRAGRKVLQRPRALGIGVCFEEAPVEQPLVDGLERLLQRLNFSGVFEAEFVKLRRRALFIDFNPRFYNQMGFEVARGLPLPVLAYQDALPEQGPRLVPETRQSLATPGKVFAHGTAFKVMIGAQRLSGVLSREEAQSWRGWYAAHEGSRVDAVSDPDDVWPARLDTLQMLQHHLRHPRIFLRAIVFNS
jgi:predicted ATP-grasp superfamily ATP-dependent carboligase